MFSREKPKKEMEMKIIRSKTESKSIRKRRDRGTAMNKTFQFIKSYIAKFDVLILTSN